VVRHRPSVPFYRAVSSSQARRSGVIISLLAAVAWVVGPPVIVVHAAPETPIAVPETPTATRASRGMSPHLIDAGGANLPRLNDGVDRVPAPNPTGRVDASSRAVPTSEDSSQALNANVTDATATSSFWGLHYYPNTSSFSWGLPPDTILSVSPTRVLELVNRRGRLFTESGKILATTNLNKLFGAVDNSGRPRRPRLFDPKVIYDRNSETPRFIAVALQASPADASPKARLSRIYVAISRTRNPDSLTSGWCKYYIPARRALGAGTDTWADYPGLGVGADSIVITTNQFSWQGDPLIQRSVVRALPKTQLEQNRNGCPQMAAPYFWKGWTDTSGKHHRLPLTMQPALHNTSPPSTSGARKPVFLLNTTENSAKYSVWRVTNVGSGAPLLWGPLVATGSGVNVAPPTAPGGAQARIETGDARMLQVVGLGDTITGVHDAACQFSGGPLEACVRILRFRLTGGSTWATLEQQTLNGGGDGWYYFYPSLAINNAGVVVSAFDVSSNNDYLGSAWGAKTWNETVFSQEVFLTQGTCALDVGYDRDRGTYRAGDYSGAATDPDGVRLWVAAERASHASGSDCAWQTRVAAITP
jgi:hypothetical protein